MSIAEPPALSPELITTLREVSLFSKLDDDASDCLAALREGRELRFHPNERIVDEGEPAALYVVLEGEFQVKRQLDGRSVFFPDLEARRVFGDLPLLLDTPFFASFDAVTPCRIYRLEEDAFWRMLSRCHSVTREVMRAMARRLKSLEVLGQQQGQLSSLGSMAAGLAHELNNPAAAARRAADDVRKSVREAQDGACMLGKLGLAPEARAYIVELRADLVRRAAAPVQLSPLDQSDREDEVGSWLDERGLADAWDASAAFVRAGFDTDSLAQLESLIAGEGLTGVLDWARAVLQTLFLLSDLEKSAVRVSDVVRAVSSYSFMDQAPQQEIDLHVGLDDTVTIMAYRLRGVRVVKEYDPKVPRLYAFGGELNQVWTNLIDNAVDALTGLPPDDKEIHIRTELQGDRVLVEIRDNGQGIDQSAKERLFEPFFTTKGVGKGTGIGLMTSRRIVVGRHGGEIRVESQPGDTRFQVYLPLEPLTTGSGLRMPTIPAELPAIEAKPAPDPITEAPAAPAAAEKPNQQEPVVLGALSPERLEALRKVPLLAPMIEDGGAIARVLESGWEVFLQPGEELGREGDPPFFSVIVDGEVRITKRIAGQEVFVGTQSTGAFLGEAPLLLDLPFIGSVYATVPTRIFRFNAETFWRIVGVCPRSARLILRTLAERLQMLISMALQQEKLSALGTLAAGLAHELNNPSSAAVRAASQLRVAVLAQLAHICQMGKAELNPEQRDFIEKLHGELSDFVPSSPSLDPLARSDGEATLAARLLDLGFEDAWELAPALCSAGFGAEWVDEVRAALPEKTVPDVLRWVERSITVENLLDDMERSTRRIATLVKAVKSYSYSGATDRVEIDLNAALDDALAVLSHKLEGVTIVRDYTPGLPKISGYPGELAQVWVNLLDNAAAAVQGKGEVRVRTALENNQALVEIGDNGSGIPAAIQRRIWEPFFTTRAVGEGTGLGLATAYRLVAERHHGDITVRSVPGDTRFQVRLPL